MNPSDKIPYVDFTRQTEDVKKELLAAVQKVLESGQFILGPEVEAFEQEFAAYCEAKYSLGVSNGTSALYLALRALGIGPGDEVITVSNSFIATVTATVLVGAKAVLIDSGEDMNIDPSKLQAAINSRTKAVIPVHLTGRVARMDEIIAIARKNGIAVVEDAAQAVGASYQGKRAGSVGDLGCFSLHPLKNLRAFGDGGMITTNDSKLHAELKKFRNIGLKSRYECQYWSPNCRLDEIQAAMLRINLRNLDRWTEERRRLAFRYNELLAPFGRVPLEGKQEHHVYQTYVVRVARRDAFMEFLQSKGVDAKIHYPVPIHRQEVAPELMAYDKDLPRTNQAATEIMSLPLYPGMTDAQQNRIVSLFKEFYGR